MILWTEWIYICHHIYLYQSCQLIMCNINFNSCQEFYFWVSHAVFILSLVNKCRDYWQHFFPIKCCHSPGLFAHTWDCLPGCMCRRGWQGAHLHLYRMPLSGGTKIEWRVPVPTSLTENHFHFCQSRGNCTSRWFSWAFSVYGAVHHCSTCVYFSSSYVKSLYLRLPFE